MPRRASLATVLFVVALAGGGLPVAARGLPPQPPGPFVVVSTRDRVDVRPGDGSCFTGVTIIFENGGILPECTLRAAIQEANASPGDDVIRFGISSSEDANCDATTTVCTISPATQLPTITRPLTIDGYTQPGASANTAATGTNAVLKIVLDGSRAGSSVDGLVVTARNSTVRGLVIYNGFRFGVIFDEATPSQGGRRLEGCFIGTDASGTAGRGNVGGVVIDDGAGNVVGGATLAARNLISGNNDTGIFLSAAATVNRIQGNLIGTDKNGTAGGVGMSNRAGVHIVGGSGNTIGGNGAAGNTIAFNRSHGIQVQASVDPGSGTGNRIFANSIANNGGLGIELGGDGVTPNDRDDPDTGANNLQNKPVLRAATDFGGVTTITGRLNSTPNQRFVLRFFANPDNGDEGQTFIGQRSVATDANGNATFTFAPDQRVAVGQTITATATDEGDNTSEFSQPRRVEPPVIGP